MERHLLMIFGLVMFVAIAGYITVMQQTSVLTGNVVRSECGSCQGVPVCGGKNSVAIDYPNACAATCDGARVLYEQPCAAIPRANPQP